MDWNNILSGLGSLAAKIAPAVVPGAGPAIEAAKAISRAFTSAKQANGGQAPADAEAQHDALFDRVKAHADNTLGRLEGN